MKTYLDISATPAEESCVQVGSENYPYWAKLECLTLIGQIRRQLGPEPESAKLITKANPHDFGTYYEVVINYDDDYPDATTYAFDCEAGRMGTEWDAEAKRQLAEAGYPPTADSVVDYNRLYGK